MHINATPRSRELPLAHAGLALGLVGGLLAGGRVIPTLLHWPFYLLVPLSAYLLIVLAVGPLRRSLTWASVGRLDGSAWAATAAVVCVSSTALLVWHAVAQPDVSEVVAEVVAGGLPSVLLTGVVFACVNALLEEVLFRGLLFDALRAAYGDFPGLVLQAAAFGVFHLHGFPSGVFGVALATVYGLMQGGLRLFTGGLALCWVAHVFADATIFVLLLRHVP
jgi:membrane protease YdiL (CAAX protease family)